MNSIRQRFGIFMILAFLSITVWVLLVICPSLAQSIPTHLLLAGSMVMNLSLAGLGIREYRKLKSAQLIMDNQILSIFPAKIKVEGCGENPKISSVKSLEVIVSCFGILLGSDVIEFNHNGISLKAIEISNDTITLTYGTEQETRNIRLLHQSFDSVRLAEIVEAFRYETGIVAKINKMEGEKC